MPPKPPKPPLYFSLFDRVRAPGPIPTGRPQDQKSRKVQDRSALLDGLKLHLMQLYFLAHILFQYSHFILSFMYIYIYNLII